VLDRFAQCAHEAGVSFEGHHAQVPRIDKAIIDAAESRGCDLIVMVTHGRGAFGEFLYGSETKAVLSGSGCRCWCCTEPGRKSPQGRLRLAKAGTHLVCAG
jgi:hypothetical protein